MYIDCIVKALFVKKERCSVKSASAEIDMIFTEVLSFYSIVISQHKLQNNMLCKEIL